MNSIDFIQSPIIVELENFKKLYDDSLLSENPLFNDVIAYLKQRRGKMMRPVLTLLMAKLYGDIQPETFMRLYLWNCFILPVCCTMMLLMRVLSVVVNLRLMLFLIIK